MCYESIIGWTGQACVVPCTKEYPLDSKDQLWFIYPLECGGFAKQQV